MKTWTSPMHRVADHLWTVLTLALALILAAPAAMVISAPFMKSQPSSVYDRYGCPVAGIGPDRGRVAGQCAKEPTAEPSSEGFGGE
jgi:hypothetical protein